MAQCPAHDDRNPSLSLTWTGGDNPLTLMYCFAGCDNQDIMAAIGLRMADLYDKPGTVTYAYTNASGSWADRFVLRDPETKKFSQNIRKKRTDKTPLYRRDLLTRARTEGLPVHLVEGEKDADALIYQGQVATTAPMGAANFDKCAVTPLTGLNVIAIADKDDAGRQWARQVYNHAGSVAASLTFKMAKVGKDVSDHIAAQIPLDDLADPPEGFPYESGAEPSVEEEESGKRQIVLTSAADIKPRRVRWLWQERLALGTLGLLAGREGIGKTTAAYWIVAEITNGTLPGECFGTARNVFIAASEDVWDFTIVPRLIAAGADRSRVFRIEVVTSQGVHSELQLPKDLGGLEAPAKEKDAALLLMDPLISRLSGDLDTHKDQSVRLALEPLVKIADRCRLAVLGTIHHNKSGSTDALQLVMGSKAFTAVARSVHTVVLDPDDETEHRRLFGTPKNNLGRSDLPTLAFTIASHPVETEDGTAWTGKCVWGENSETRINDAIRKTATEETEDSGATAEAVQWLRDYLITERGSKESATIKSAGRSAGHSESALQRARAKLRIITESRGMPRKTWWFLPGDSRVNGHSSSHFTSHVKPQGRVI
jgi:AAA domain-containing protein